MSNEDSLISFLIKHRENIGLTDGLYYYNERYSEICIENNHLKFIKGYLPCDGTTPHIIWSFEYDYIRGHSVYKESPKLKTGKVLWVGKWYNNINTIIRESRKNALYIGGTPIDSYYNNWLPIWEELTKPVKL